jgi:ubiquitin-protein ligase
VSLQHFLNPVIREPCQVLLKDVFPRYISFQLLFHFDCTEFETNPTFFFIKERKNWRKDHPVGFYARPVSNYDGSSNILKWETGIPGKPGTDWEGGGKIEIGNVIVSYAISFYLTPTFGPFSSYSVQGTCAQHKYSSTAPSILTVMGSSILQVMIDFSHDYPSKPPVCRFVPPLFHPNVYSDGKVCLSILNEGQDWKPGVCFFHTLMSFIRWKFLSIIHYPPPWKLIHSILTDNGQTDSFGNTKFIDRT